MSTDRDGYPVHAPWTVCPSCGVGRGEDHRLSCPQRAKPPTLARPTMHLFTERRTASCFTVTCDCGWRFAVGRRLNAHGQQTRDAKRKHLRDVQANRQQRDR